MANTTPLELTIEAVKATPPATAAALVLFGYTLNEWVAIMSLLLIFLQIVFMIKKNVFDKKGNDD
jgi:hypothetical protein